VIRISQQGINPQKAVFYYSLAASLRSKSSPVPISRSASIIRSNAPSAMAATSATFAASCREPTTGSGGGAGAVSPCI